MSHVKIRVWPRCSWTMRPPAWKLQHNLRSCAFLTAGLRPTNAILLLVCSRARLNYYTTALIVMLSYVGFGWNYVLVSPDIRMIKKSIGFVLRFAHSSVIFSLKNFPNYLPVYHHFEWCCQREELMVIFCTSTDTSFYPLNWVISCTIIMALISSVLRADHWPLWPPWEVTSRLASVTCDLT